MIKIKSTDKEEIMAQLRAYSLDEIFESLAEYIARENEDDVPKIILSPEQFNAMFRIRGLQIDDIRMLMPEVDAAHETCSIRAERRGRPRKVAVDDEEKLPL